MEVAAWGALIAILQEHPEAHRQRMQKSLGNDSTSGRVKFRKINADDAVVNTIANSVGEGTPYGLWPDGSGNTLNSNSAAGAVANSADGGSFSVRGGRLQPGAAAGMFLEFDTIVDAFVCRVP